MGKYIRCIVLLLLIAAAVCLGIRFYPVWRAARYLHENMDLAHYAYELEVELDSGALRREYGSLFTVLTGMTGFEEDALCHLTVRGNVWEDTIHVLLYPQGAGNPLVELYLGNDMDVINETLIYHAVRSHLAEQFRLFGLVLPEQEESLYMSLEQVEQRFGLDLESVRNFGLPFTGDEISAVRYFILLAVMDREKGEGRSLYSLETGQMAAGIEVPEGGSDVPLTLRLHIEKPGETDEKILGIISRLGFPVDRGRLSMVKSVSLTMVPGGNEIVMPENFVNQTVVELISRIRELLIKLFG